MNTTKEFRVAVQAVRDQLTLSFAKMQDRGTFLGVADAFRQEYADFFQGGAIHTHVTQLFWHRLQLSKRRLEQLGVTMKATAVRRGTDRDRAVHWGQDGRHLTARIEEPVHATRTFQQNGRTLGVQRDREHAHYAVVESLKEDATYICPSCGAPETTQNLLGGCPFCGTKFQLEDFARKVSSFTFHSRPRVLYRTNPWLLWSLYLVGIIVLFALLLVRGLLHDPGLLYYQRGAMRFSSGMDNIIHLWGILALIGFAVVFYRAFFRAAKYGFGNHRRSAAWARFRNRGQVIDDCFSMESFVAGLENKLVATHFAGSYDELSTFVRCDLSTLLPRYANVVECSVGYISFRDISVDDVYQRARLKVELELLTLERGRIQTRPEVVDLELIKAREQHAQELCDVVALKCAGCGAPVSLMEGGRCAFCQNALQLEHYDWVISDYRSSRK